MLPASYEDYVIGDFGHIEVRPSKPQVNGFVVGVPHGATEPDAIDYAKTISDATGAGIDRFWLREQANRRGTAITS